MGLNVHIHNGHYQFDGPHTSISALAAASGVYVISTVVNGFHKVIDVGESHDINNRVASHDRKNTWQQHISDTLYASALYCDEPSRMAIEQQIRLFHNPPCGIR